MPFLLDRCPICRAAVADSQNTVCRRCGSQLQYVKMAMTTAEKLRDLARRQLAAGEKEASLETAQQAFSMYRTAETIETLAAAFAENMQVSNGLATLRLLWDMDGNRD